MSEKNTHTLIHMSGESADRQGAKRPVARDGRRHLAGRGVMVEQQATRHVLMIRPQRFASNVQTAESNRFQQSAAPDEVAQAQATALREFDGLAESLRRAGVQTHLFDDTPEPHTPDSIFPNNWVSFHADGTVALYPMLAPNRRLERRTDILQALRAEHGFHISRTLDFTAYEREEKFLEGTGSLVLDRVHRIAYACLSPRTDARVLTDFARQLNYQLVTFKAQDRDGAPIYHTNVLMCVGARFAVVCSAAIVRSARDTVFDALRSTGHVIVDIHPEQMYAFAGNMLELQDQQGGSLVAMSAGAHRSLEPAQRATLEQLSGPLIAAAIPTIERLGGGSVRCMLAEIFLPKTTSNDPSPA